MHRKPRFCSTNSMSSAIWAKRWMRSARASMCGSRAASGATSKVRSTRCCRARLPAIRHDHVAHAIGRFIRQHELEAGDLAGMGLVADVLGAAVVPDQLTHVLVADLVYTTIDEIFVGLV